MSETEMRYATAWIAGFAGLLGAIIGSLIAPLVQWQIEKRKFKHNRRLEYIKDWRRFIYSKEFSIDSFHKTMTYGTIYKYLSEEVRNAIENNNTPVLEASKDKSIQIILLDEVARIERDWELI